MPIDWLDPWYAVDDAEGDHLAREMRHRISPGHRLHGVTISVIGRRKDRQEVLVRLLDGSARLGVVHLTGRGGETPDPQWPPIIIYENQRAWEVDGLGLDHEIWWSCQMFDEFDD